MNTARKGRGGAVTSVPFSARIRAVWDPSQRATAKALVAVVLAFPGICAGGKESILSGRIPKRYAFDPRGQRLSCRIEKQDAGGDLKVILIAGDTTRSVQQTNTRGSVINVSYTGD